MAKFFINRPIVAICISIIIVILGLMSIMTLPLAQYPDIIPPQVNIEATYPGGDCLTVAESVATPIEEQIMGVDGMEYVTSINGNDGRSSINVVFTVGTDPNEDLILGQMRYGQAQSQLPSEVQRIGVNLRKRSSMPVLLVSLVSKQGTVSALELTNFANIRLVDEMKRLEGVSDVNVFGVGKYAMRVWLDPLKLASLKMTSQEVIQAINEQNTVNPAGQIGAEPAPVGQDFTVTVRTQGRLSTKEQFEEIVIRDIDGQQVYLRDVARIELGSDTYSIQSRVNGNPSSALAIYQDPSANAIRTAEAVINRMEQLKADFLPGMEYVVTFDTTRPISEGIDEIIQTLVEALALVIIVVFIFLQGWRATMIPFFAVPVSIIGTFAVFPMLGFSINTISMIGIVLSIGLVVDDAIVVVEAVEHHIEKGLSPRDATIVAMEEVSGPVVAIALVLSAVFLPCLIIPGIAGSLFAQFAVTISISILISAFNALSLSPALSALLLKHKDLNAKGPLNYFYRGFNKGFNKTADGYQKICGFMIRKSWLSLPVLLLVSLLVIPLEQRIPGGFIPEEDQGYLFAGIQLPVNSSLQRTSVASSQIESILSSIPEVENYTCIMGLNFQNFARMSNNAFFFIQLKRTAERERTARQVYEELQGRLTKVTGGFPYAAVPPAIPGIGTSGGVTFVLQDTAGRGGDFLMENAMKFKAAMAGLPEINDKAIIDTMAPSVPQKFVEIDRQKAQMHHVSIASATSALQNYLGSAFVNYISLFGKQWPVYVQGEPEARENIEKMNNFFVLNKNHDAVPLSSITSVKDVQAPEFILRMNRYDSYKINVAANKGYSSGQVMEALEKLHAEIMPRGIAMDYIEMSYQENKARQGLPLWAIFALSGLFTFLILASLYENWFSPISIFMTVPIAVVGSLAALAINAFELSVYAEIGLIMLIGLAAKNAILIVEFAALERERGKSLYEACLSGARIRLRPILMTSFAFIFGCVALAMAQGSGAMARKVIGMTVIGGMTTATILGIFFVPVCYYVVMRLSGVPSGIKRKRRKSGQTPAPALPDNHSTLDIPN